jgi:membrane protein DedA with SNARE-associated domain
MLEQIIDWLVNTIGQWGYFGIVVLMFLESSFFPFPSEVVVPPAGYLAAQGRMSLWLVVLAGVAGSLFGAIFNYWLAAKWGRPFFEKYGRYMFISQKTLARADSFFEQHGHISTFIGRLIPGIRQYISLPAGLVRMDMLLFSLFTAFGALIWVVVLALLGYWLGNNQEVFATYLHEITIGIVFLCLVFVGIYVLLLKKFKKR